MLKYKEEQRATSARPLFMAKRPQGSGSEEPRVEFTLHCEKLNPKSCWCVVLRSLLGNSLFLTASKAPLNSYRSVTLCCIAQSSLPACGKGFQEQKLPVKDHRESLLWQGDPEFIVKEKSLSSRDRAQDSSSLILWRSGKKQL